MLNIFRILLPIICFIITVFTIQKIKPPKQILNIIICLSPIAGILNLIVDFIQQKTNFWLYTLKNMFYIFPLDLYFSVTLILGIVIPIIYWYLDKKTKFLKLFILILPVYFLIQDYFVISITKNDIIETINPYWPIMDLFSLGIIIYGTLFLENIFIKKIILKKEKNNI